jgi:DNA-binding GntR family transcriptional regulator
MGILAEDHSEYQNSLCGRIFEKLQHDILDGVFSPGENLIETKLSKDLGVSRTPVREAIKQLELEGLVRFIPNKGAIVIGVDKKDIDDIYTIRMMIEGLAARWAAENITEDEVNKLRESVDLEEFYTLKNDVDRILELDSRFHKIMFKACKSKPLLYMLNNFHQYIQKARNEAFKVPGRAQEVLMEHRAILDAIINRDSDKAEKLTYEHVKKAQNNFRKKEKQLDDNMKGEINK